MRFKLKIDLVVFKSKHVVQPGGHRLFVILCQDSHPLFIKVEEILRFITNDHVPWVETLLKRKGVLKKRVHGDVY